MSGDLRDRLRLIVVTDPDCGVGRNVLDVTRAALRGGAPAVQLRMKDAPARDMAELARALLVETRTAGALLFINDRVDVALGVGADGAHVGQADLPAAAARHIAPPGFLLGVSAETVELARRAEAAGADYVGVGPVYGTGSKSDAGDAIGLDRVTEVASAVHIPVVAIGGITAANASEAIRANAAGMAVISAVMRASDPEAAVRLLLGAHG